MVKKSKTDKIYSDGMTHLTRDIAYIRDETKKYDRENTTLTQDFNITHREVEELEDNFNDAKMEYE